LIDKVRLQWELCKERTERKHI